MGRCHAEYSLLSAEMSKPAHVRAHPCRLARLVHHVDRVDSDPVGTRHPENRFARPLMGTTRISLNDNLLLPPDRDARARAGVLDPAGNKQEEESKRRRQRVHPGSMPTASPRFKGVETGVS